MGLIVLHALWDLETVLLVADSSDVIMKNASQIVFTYPVLVWLGFAFVLLPPAYLIWIHPYLIRRRFVK